MNNHKLVFTLLLSVTFFLLLSFASAKNSNITLLENSDRKLVFDLELDDPRFIREGEKIYAAYPEASFYFDTHGNYLPYITKFCNIPSLKSAQVRLINVTRQSKKIDNYLKVDLKSVKNRLETQTITTEFAGKKGRLPIHTVKIYPVTYNAQNSELEWISSAQIEIIIPKQTNTVHFNKISSRLSSKGLTDKLLINGSQSLYATTSNSETELLDKAGSTPPDNPIFNYTQQYKIAIHSTGIYNITYEDLVSAEYPVELINPKRLRLFNKGFEIPIYFRGDKDEQFNEGDYFEFWGEKNEKTFLEQFPDQYADPFTDINIYWLVYGETNGRRLVEESGGLSKTVPGTFIKPYAYTETIHFEKDRFRETLGEITAGINKPVYEMDHWFWDSGVAAVESRTYDFYLPHPFAYGAEVYVNAAFRGRTTDNAIIGPGKGHQASIWLNQVKIDEIIPQDEWWGQQLRFLGNDANNGLPQSNLKNGQNQLRIDMEQAGVTDVVMLNWFDVSYLRKYRAHQDLLKFRVQENLPPNMTPQFELDGFTDEKIELYKIGVSKIVNNKIDYYRNNEEQYSSYRIRFQDDVYDSNVEYVALTEEQKKKPLYIKKFKLWKSDQPEITLLNSSNSAEYLIVTNDLLYINSTRLRTLKNEQGLRAEVVQVENIYDIFNYGIKSPIAIKDFIQYVYDNWNQSYPLKYVVFVGDASFDYRGISKPGADMVPTMLFETHTHGAAAADFWYSLLDGDDYIPDIIVSRIPATNNEDLTFYIDKVENYQKNPQVDTWRNTTLFISGNDASSGDREYLTNQPIFRSQNNRLIQMKKPDQLFARKLNTVKNENIPGFDPDFGSTTDLIEYFDDGVSFINFFGHGGGGIWADVQLLNLTDVERLNNGNKLPFITSMTCYTGAFEDMGQRLGEKLLFAENKGAIGMLAASGVGWKYNDFTIGWSIYDYLWEDNLTFGEAVNLMKIYYATNPTYFTEEASFTTWSYFDLYPSMLMQYNLLGDPALKLQKPDQSIEISISNPTPANGDTIIATLSSSIISGTGQIELVDSNSKLLLEEFININNSNTDVEIALPIDSVSKTLSLRAYISDGTSDASGSAEIAIQSSLIASIATVPAEPKVEEPIQFAIKVDSFTDIDSISLYSFKEVRDKITHYYPQSILMEKVNDTLFQSVEPFAGFNHGGEKIFNVFMRDADTVDYIFRWQRLWITDDRPDLNVLPNSLSYTGKENLKLAVDVRNEATIDLNDVTIAAYDGAGLITESPFAQQTVSFSGGEKKHLEFDYLAQDLDDFRRFKIVVDPDNSFVERNEENNILEVELPTDHLLIRKQLGTSNDDMTNDTLLLNKRWNLYIAKNTLTASTILHFKDEDIHNLIENSDQTDLEFVQWNTTGDTSALYLDFKNFKDTPLGATAVLYVDIDSALVNPQNLERLAFHRFDDYLNRWIKMESTYAGKKLSTRINSSGLYTIFSNQDEKEPFIEITANGRTLHPKMYLTKAPNIAFILQDENGVNFRESFKVFINDDPISEDAITYPADLQNANTISVQATPKLEQGTHLLRVEAADVNGNLATKEVEFIVSNDFQFVVYGNYPNPFDTETRISYNVAGEELDDLSIKIYTTSGRLIRSRLLYSEISDENILDLNYHELIWDGTDDDGNEVANGVYFAVISGSSKGKTVKHTIKMARLK